MEKTEIETTNSSNVSKIAYDFEQKELCVTFRTNKTYCYSEVPETTWQALKEAESVGKYINSHIKKSYQFKAL